MSRLAGLVHPDRAAVVLDAFGVRVFVVPVVALVDALEQVVQPPSPWAASTSSSDAQTEVASGWPAFGNIGTAVNAKPLIMAVNWEAVASDWGRGTSVFWRLVKVGVYLLDGLGVRLPLLVLGARR
jgi:hypothetical protein